MCVLPLYNELVTKLESLIGEFKFSADINLKLERIECLLELLGNPQDSFSVIHVGGTSGKGSTSSYISSILQNDAYKTGVFLSPYLQVLNEVCLINGSPAKTKDLLDAYDEIEPFFAEVANKTRFGKPSFFEVKLALSLMLYKRHNVDVAIIEVGLGGSLDASNTLDTDVSVLVSIGLDHTEILGDTIEKIASDKTGIIKKNGVVICGFIQDSARRIAQEKATEEEAKILFINKDYKYTYCNGKAAIQTEDFYSQNLNLSLKGEHQAHNAACAVAAYGEFTKKHKKRFSKEAVIQGLSQAVIHGRSEIVQDAPVVILDGAHNPDKLNAFFNRLAELTTSPILIIALKKGRNVNSEIYSLFEKTNAKEIIVTTFSDKGIWESLPSDQLMRDIQKNSNSTLEISSIPDPMDAILYALKIANADDVIAVTGSLFLVGDIREHWYSTKKILEHIEKGESL